MINFKRITLAVAVCLIGAGMFIPSMAHAQLRIDVTKGRPEPLPIAITNFDVQSGASAQMAAEMATVITNDLKNSGLFRPLPSGAFIQNAQQIAASGPAFQEWKAVNAQALVSGVLKQGGDGKTRVEFRLWDVLSQQQLTGTAYMTTPENWRRIAHIIADEIYKRLTGEEGYFDTRIVYIAESGSAQQRVKRLAIMDQDGANHKYLTDGRALVLTPRFSPDTAEITYLAYYNNKPRVYLYNIDTGRQEVLGDFPGMTFAPRFSPDGGSVIMSLAQNGNSDIYVMNLSTRRAKKITDNAAIDTSPSFSPDGKQIVFESDRGGKQQLYTMNADGSNVKRITFGDGRYANPVWSPRGDLIAFTKMKGGQFFIGVVRTDGSGERLITTAYHVEGPTWSPNGRVLAYFKESSTGSGAKARLYSIDLTGYNERSLATPQGASDPAWSPLNP